MDNIKSLSLHPDLVISQKSAIDRIGRLATEAVTTRASNYATQIRIVRSYAKARCEKYQNCRSEDYCWLCASGQNGSYFRGEVCKSCKLLVDLVPGPKVQGLVQIQP